MKETEMNLRDRIRRRRQYKMLVREMSEFSHCELTELGITRADIGRIAWDAAYGEPMPGRSG
jgi:uncharacterized protein YjiS (DUF1127 family)